MDRDTGRMPGSAASRGGTARISVRLAGTKYPEPGWAAMYPSAASCSNTATTVLRARPSTAARARVEGSRAPAPSCPSAIAARNAAASWRDSGKGAPWSSAAIHSAAPAGRARADGGEVALSGGMARSIADPQGRLAIGRNIMGLETAGVA